MKDLLYSMKINRFIQRDLIENNAQFCDLKYANRLNKSDSIDLIRANREKYAKLQNNHKNPKLSIVV
jgi:hypothetical protein